MLANAKPRKGRFMPGDARGLSGRVPTNVIATADQAAIEALVSELLESLNRPVTIIDRISAEVLAEPSCNRAPTVRAANPIAASGLIARLMANGPFQTANKAENR